MFPLPLSLNQYIIRCDAPTSAQLAFQDPASPSMIAIIALHHEISYILLLIAGSLGYLLYRPIQSHTRNQQSHSLYSNEQSTLEIIWTSIPSAILLLLGGPSLALLFSLDSIGQPVLTMKAIAHQWYWSYEYTDSTINQTTYESYIIETNELKSGDLRLLETDQPATLPTYIHIRMLITSNDVLHSYAIPSLGIKIDAIPGRLNQAAIIISRSGSYYGQCSEICGTNHGFMPINIEATSLKQYLDWLIRQSSDSTT
nr:cytochrome c oxidase subunit II [Rhodosorus marinus]